MERTEVLRSLDDFVTVLTGLGVVKEVNIPGGETQVKDQGVNSPSNADDGDISAFVGQECWNQGKQTHDFPFIARGLFSLRLLRRSGMWAERKEAFLPFVLLLDSAALSITRCNRRQKMVRCRED